MVLAENLISKWEFVQFRVKTVHCTVYYQTWRLGVLKKRSRPQCVTFFAESHSYQGTIRNFRELFQIDTHFFSFYVFSCPGSSIPDLGQWVSKSVSRCHFWMLTQRGNFDTWDPSNILSRQKDKKRQKDKETKRQKDKNKKRKNTNNLNITKRYKL